MKDEINYCPVCKNKGPFEYFEICPNCGWEQDPVQNEDIYFPGGANKLSLIEYQYIHNNIKEKQKNYKWDFNSKIIKEIIDQYDDNNQCIYCGKEQVHIGDKCPSCGWIKCYVQEHDKEVSNLINQSSLINYKK